MPPCLSLRRDRRSIKAIASRRRSSGTRWNSHPVELRRGFSRAWRLTFPLNAHLLAAQLRVLHAGNDRINKVKLTDIFEKPTDIAKQLGVPLSEKTASDLQSLAPAQLTAFKDETDRELVAFFHAVVRDGRYLDVWYTRPYEVSQALKVKLSNEAIERLVAGGAAAAFFQRGPSQQLSPIAIVGIAILVIIVVIWAFSEAPIEDFVEDRSGLDKI